MPNAKKAIFVPRTRNTPRETNQDRYYIGRAIVVPKIVEEKNKQEEDLPDEYKCHKKVFSEKHSQRLPGHTIWDHAIELLPKAPTTLPVRLIHLNPKEKEEMHKFVAKHLDQGTIRDFKSPYAASFFFIKKKDRKLRPVQDYCPINKWTKKNQNVAPLIPQTID